MSSHIEWADSDSVTYVPPWHSVPGCEPVGPDSPDYDGEANSQGAHILLFTTGSDGCAITFSSLEHVHEWLDDMKARLPKPAPGKDAGLDEIEAFLNG